MELKNEFEVNVAVPEAWKVLTDIERIAPCLPGAELREIAGEEYRGIVKVKLGPISAEYKGVARFTELDRERYRAVLRADGRETRGQGNATATITADLVPSAKGTKVSVVTDLAITGKVAQFGRGVLGDVSSKLLGQFAENLEQTVLLGEDGRAVGGASLARADASEQAEADAGETTGPAEAAKPARRSRRGRPSADVAGVTEDVPREDRGSESSLRSDAASDLKSAVARAPAASSVLEEAELGYRRIEASGSPTVTEPVDLLEVAGGSILKRLLPVVGVVVLLVALGVAARRIRHTL